MPGPAPTPTSIKLLRGNPGKRRINLDEPHFDAAVVTTPPGWLADDHAIQMWIKLFPVLARAGTLTEADTDLFGAMCERWGTYRRCVEALKGGLTVTGKTGWVTVRPEAALAATALKQYLDLAAQFGIGAASRSRVMVPGIPPGSVHREKKPGDDWLERYGHA